MSIVEKMAEAIWEAKDFCPWDKAGQRVKHPCIRDAQIAWDVVKAEMLGKESLIRFDTWIRGQLEIPNQLEVDFDDEQIMLFYRIWQASLTAAMQKVEE